MILGTLIALLLAQLGSFMRLLLTTGLVLVWAMPVVVAVNIWVWMFDFEFGVFNWALTELGVGDYIHHDWFENPTTGFAIIMARRRLGRDPVRRDHGLRRADPGAEGARRGGLDRRRRARARIFRDITLPLLKPIFVILTSLSIIWDFQVFNQVWIMRGNNPSSDYYLMSVYAFVESFRLSEYGYGAADRGRDGRDHALVTFFYIRQMVRIGEVR